MNKKARKNFAILLSFFLLLLNKGYVSAEINAQIPAIEGKSGILIEANSNKILYEKDIHRKLAMASTTKILTAIVALEKGKPDDIVTVPYDASVVEGSQVYLESGEKQRLEDLLYALMLRSGNDAAISIAKYIGKSEKGFAKLMNKKAKEIGACESNFMNPHGLDNPDHYTTAYDLGLISSYAIKNPQFRKVVSTKRWNMPWPGNEYGRLLLNKNKMLYQYQDAIGIKTGYTKKTGRCLVSAAERDGMILVSVVLADYNWWEDSKKLLDYGFENYESKEILKSKQYNIKVAVKAGVKKFINCSNKENCKIVDKKSNINNQKYSLKAEYKKDLKAPIAKGEEIGTVKIYLNGELYKKYPLTANEDLKKKQIVVDNITKIKSNFIKIIKKVF
jgi:D-alanyl-D-alanine carboxypeptidase (penicillin-binding protein 5/6)